MDSMPKCYGRAISANNPITNPKKTKKSVHNHKPLPERTQALETVENMMEQAAISDNNPRTVQNNCLTGLGAVAAVHLPKPLNLTSCIKRVRKEKVNTRG